jgi:probable F420-dependent oxidoreductase
MRIGVVYPQTEMPTDPGTVKQFVQGVEALGYKHILAFDHVLGADPVVHQDWTWGYNVDTTFHEPLVLFGFLAGITTLELVTGVIIAPQRQTALMAKQAAEVDILSNGRLRLGLGVGWNSVEYEALGQDFATRGSREEEQIDLLRRLWTERTVTHTGRFDRVTGAGIAPLPVQRPIPIWMGGQSAAALRRIGRMADGWFPLMSPGVELDKARALIGKAAGEMGRDLASFGVEGRINWGGGDTQRLVDRVQRWMDVGATHVAINTMGRELSDVGSHLEVLTCAAGALELHR